MTTRDRQESARASLAGMSPIWVKGPLRVGENTRAKRSSPAWAKKRGGSAPSRFIAWSKQEQASIQQQLELMQSGKALTGDNDGSGGSYHRQFDRTSQGQTGRTSLF